MNFPAVLQKVTVALDKAGAAYMLTGSFASAFYGVPRSTQDIDLVIAATPVQLRGFLGSLPSTDYYVDVDAAVDAHHRESMFNLIDLGSGWKIDLMIRKSRPFSWEEFGRRRLVDVQGIPLYVASAEDIVIAKLEWAKLGKSQRQIEDAAGIVKIQGQLLDLAYLEKWIRELDLHKEWVKALGLTDDKLSSERKD
jgi:hypothetical protein